MGSFSSEHGFFRESLVYYYPDSFYFFNKMASWGSYVSGFSVIIFMWALVDALLPSNREENFDIKATEIVDSN